jgi:hypothetical protein
MDHAAPAGPDVDLLSLPDSFMHLLFLRLSNAERKVFRTLCSASRRIINNNVTMLSLNPNDALSLDDWSRIPARFPDLVSLVLASSFGINSSTVAALLIAARAWRRFHSLDLTGIPGLDLAVAHIIATTCASIRTLKCKLIPPGMPQTFDRISSMTNLTQLHITETVSIAAANLACLSNLQSLRNLHLDHCKLQHDSSIHAISTLSSLQDLSLWETGPTDSAAIQALSVLSRLSSLSISCKQQLPDLVAIAHLSSLRHLRYNGESHLADGSLTTGELDDGVTLMPLQQITRLDMPAVNLIGPAANAALLLLPNLKVLSCMRLQPTNDADLRGSEVTRLCTVQVPTRAEPSLDLLESIPPSVLELSVDQVCCSNHLQQLQHATAITSLTLNNLAIITRPGPIFSSILPALGLLQRLSLANNVTMEDTAFKALALATALTSLCISNFDSITDLGLSALVSCTGLRELTLQQCTELTPNAPAMLARCMPSLRRLAVLRCAQITAVCKPWVEQWAGRAALVVEVDGA